MSQGDDMTGSCLVSNDRPGSAAGCISCLTQSGPVPGAGERPVSAAGCTAK